MNTNIEFDIVLLPARLEYDDGFDKKEVIFFRTSSDEHVMFTNLKTVDQIPADLRDLCDSSADLALLAVTIEFDYSVAHVNSDEGGKARIDRWALCFANEFLTGMCNQDSVARLVRCDVAKWLDPVSGDGGEWVRKAKLPS